MKKRIYNQAALFGPNYAFLVVLSPPEKVKADIAQFKKELNSIAEIGERNLHSIAHITLTDRLTDDADFSEAVALLLKNQKPFTIKLNGWQLFDHGHSVTVVVNVTTTEPVNHLAALLRSRSKSPHISLAKRIPHSTFDKLRPWLEKLDYSAEWICSEVIVLRKLMSEKHLGFKELFTIPLNPGSY